MRACAASRCRLWTGCTRCGREAWKERPFSWWTLRDVARLRREMRAEAYDVCVDLQGSIRSALVGRMAGAKRFVGSAEPRERQARWLYGERVKLAAKSVIAQACELVSAAVGEPVVACAVELPRDVEAERWAASTLRFAADGNEAGGERGWVLLIPQCGWGAKEWGAEKYRELAARLAGLGFCVLVNAAVPAEPVRADLMRRRLRRRARRRRWR